MNNKYNPDIHKRRSIRLRNYDYSQQGLYFVTLCVKNGIHLFGEVMKNGKGEKFFAPTESGKIVEKCWFEIPQHYPNVILHEFVTMPNHLHGIIEIAMSDTVGAKNLSPEYKMQSDTRANNDSPLRRPTGTSRTLGAIVRGFKIGVTKQMGFSPWQRSFHEHIIRDKNAHTRIAEYIENNPATWETDRFYN